MNRLAELIPSEQLLAFLEKAEIAISTIGNIEARIAKLIRFQNEGLLPYQRGRTNT